MSLRWRAHLGADVSALLDGQLPAEDEERAWSHAMTCTECHRLVQREGRLKARLGALADPAEDKAVPGALYDVERLPVPVSSPRSRRSTLATVGIGSVSAALLGAAALTALPGPVGDEVSADIAGVVGSSVTSLGNAWNDLTH